MGTRGFYNIDTFIQRLESGEAKDLLDICKFRFEEYYLGRCFGKLLSWELKAIQDANHPKYPGITAREQLLSLLKKKREDFPELLTDISAEVFKGIKLP